MSAARSIWLAYHDVYEGKLSPAVPRTAAVYHVGRERFRSHLEAIREGGLPVVTAAESIAGSGAAATDHVVLTFDDGWEGSLTVGLACLLEAGMRATFFVTHDCVGRPRFAARAHLLEALRAGMEIGSHGRTHRLLAELGEAEIRAELGESKAFLEEELGEPVTAGSAPGGSWSPLVGQLAGEAGYSSLATSRPGINHSGSDPFRLRRLVVRHHTAPATIESWTRFSMADVLLRHAVLDVPRRVLGARRYAALRRRVYGTGVEEDVLALGVRPGGRGK